VIRWLGTLPAGVIFVLFGAIAVGLTLLFDVLMRRVVKPETRNRANSTASVTLQVTATIYAILIAFVIVDAYSQGRDAQAQISAKAAALSVVFENSRDLPDTVGGEIRERTLDYARAVVRRGIPRLSETSDPSRKTDEQLERIFRAVQRFEPRTPSEVAAYDATVRALDDVVSTRAKLLDAARPTIPNALIILLVFIGLVVMAVATLLDTQHRGSHLFILSALALVIWVTLALVLSLNYPFGGLIRVTDAPIQDFIDFRAAR